VATVSLITALSEEVGEQIYQTEYQFMCEYQVRT